MHSSEGGEDFVLPDPYHWPKAAKSRPDIYTSRMAALWPKAIIEDPLLGDPVSSISFILDKNIQIGS